MEWLDPVLKLLPAGGWGAFLLLIGVVVWLVLTDRLVSRQRLLDVMADRDKWRETAEKQDARNDELVQQNGMLTGQLGIVEATMRAMPTHREIAS